MADMSAAVTSFHSQSRALHQGDAIRVFSRSADKWVDGEVVKLIEGNFVRVEYEIGEDWCGKTLHMHSDQLNIQTMVGPSGLSPATVRSSVCSLTSSVVEHDPGANFIDIAEAASALRQHVFVQLGKQGSKPVFDAVGRLTYVKNNSFVTKEVMTCDCTIEYNGSFDEDMLLKVYTLDHKYPAEHYSMYTLSGYIHAMQEPRISLSVAAGCYLGFVIHKDLNKDWLWKMKQEDPDKYAAFISRSDPGGYSERDDPVGKGSASQADYLISFTTANKAEDDLWLKELSEHRVYGPHGNRPITFCTDRSLGFGGHFHAPAGIYLAKHGFCQPTAPGAWFDEYRKASQQTRFGLLVLNPSPAYFKSAACLREWGMPNMQAGSKKNWNPKYKSTYRKVVAMNRFWVYWWYDEPRKGRKNGAPAIVSYPEYAASAKQQHGWVAPKPGSAAQIDFKNMIRKT
mmetsp:Transcript_37718/g.66316  ORF Transcript_37718/g.66316 Transcript_37718/m.66316 type:complete len:455 (+) Transcript_37718:161-1525(+)